MPRKKMGEKRVSLVFEPGEQSGWVASIEEVPGCHTQGRSISHARKRIREALALWIGDRAAETAELTEQFPFPAAILRSVQQLGELREQIEELREPFTKLRNRMVHQLVDDQGLSYRDTADILGLSHARIEQLVNTPPSPKRKRPTRNRSVAKSRR